MRVLRFSGTRLGIPILSAEVVGGSFSSFSNAPSFDFFGFQSFVKLSINPSANGVPAKIPITFLNPTTNGKIIIAAIVKVPASGEENKVLNPRPKGQVKKKLEEVTTEKLSQYDSIC